MLLKNNHRTIIYWKKRDTTPPRSNNRRSKTEGESENNLYKQVLHTDMYCVEVSRTEVLVNRKKNIAMKVKCNLGLGWLRRYIFILQYILWVDSTQLQFKLYNIYL